MKSFGVSGVWWIPSKSDEYFAGKLSFHPDVGGKLNIVHVQESETRRPEFHSNRLNLIHGYVGDMTHVTLLHCESSSGPSTHVGKNGTPNVTEITLDVEYILIASSAIGNAYFHSVDDIMFEQIWVSYPYLAEWLMEPNLESYDREAHKYSKSGFEPVQVAIDRSSVTVTFDDPIRIESQTKQHLPEYLKLINVHLADFLTFTTSQTNFPVRVVGFAENVTVEIFYRVTGFSEKHEEYMTSYEMLFTFRDVSPSLKDSLNKWISNRNRLGVIYDLFLKPYYGKVTEFETAFLFLAQALEVFHRKKYPKKRHLKKPEFKELRDAIISAIPTTVGSGHQKRQVSEEHRQHLEGIISAMGNSYSLKTRILDLLQECTSSGNSEQWQQIISIIIGSDWNDFAVKVRDTRNYHTHHDKPSKHVIPPEHLQEYYWTILLLIKMLLLIEMGFKFRQVQHAIIQTSIQIDLIVALRNKRLGLQRDSP